MGFQNPVVAGKTLVREAIQSPNYVAGSSGWTINRDGTAEFAQIQLRGALSTGFAPNPRITVDDSLTLSSPAVAFYDGVNPDPGFIYGTDDGTQTALHMITGHVAGPGTAGASLLLGTDGFYVNHETQNLGLGIDWDPDPEIGSVQAIHRGGVATLTSNGNYSWVSLLVDGKVGTGTTTTAVGTGDTNIIAANNANTPVISDRAYLALVQIDYYRASVGALARLDMKLWNGAVGGTQLGGTARIPMAGPLSTARRTAVGMFVWRAASTQTMANLNLSLATTDTTVGQNWTAEVNAGFSFTVHEIGDASNISNL